MVERQDVKNDDKQQLPHDGKEPPSLIGRRDYLMAVGAIGTTAAVGAAMGTAAADEYELIELDTGQEITYDIGPGRRDGTTLENVLIDATAPRSGVWIRTRGDGWVIRNVGIRGALGVGDGGGSTYHSAFDSSQSRSQLIRASGNGVIENCYFGDGVTLGVDRTCVLSSRDHNGHIDVRNCNIGGWSTTAFYITGFAEVGSGGSYTIDNCYFHNNNISHIRAVGNVDVHDTVVTNTNHVRYSPITNGGIHRVINSRGLWARRGNRNLVTNYYNCDIDVGPHNAHDPIWDEIPHTDNSILRVNRTGSSPAVYGQDSSIRLHDCRVNGRISGNVQQNNVNGDPDTTPPEGVPLTAEEAASGENWPPWDYILTVDGSEETERADYTFLVNGDVRPSPQYRAPINRDIIEIDELDDNQTRVTNAIANARNSYEITGCIIDFELLDGPQKTWYRDGELIDFEEIIDCEFNEEEESDDEEEEEVNEESESSDNPNGSETTDQDDNRSEDNPSNLENSIIFDGTISEGVGSYHVEVSGEIEQAPNLSTDGELPWDSLQPKMSDGVVSGVVGNARDGYRFSGTITKLKVYGRVAVTFDDGED